MSKSRKLSRTFTLVAAFCVAPFALTACTTTDDGNPKFAPVQPTSPPVVPANWVNPSAPPNQYIVLPSPSNSEKNVKLRIVKQADGSFTLDYDADRGSVIDAILRMRTGIESNRADIAVLLMHEFTTNLKSIGSAVVDLQGQLAALKASQVQVQTPSGQNLATLKQELLGDIAGLIRAELARRASGAGGATP
jgi:hypothetical protein